MQLLCLGADDLVQALPMREALDTARQAYVALARERACVPPRCVLPAPAPDGTILVMGGSVPGVGLTAKVVVIKPSNQSEGLPGTAGLVVVQDLDSGIPVAVCDGEFLTAWRTGAATGCATAALARQDAHDALVIGTGSQAAAQVQGLDAARSWETIRIWGRNGDRSAELVDRLKGSTQARLAVATDLEGAVRDADAIAMATAATEPVVHGAWLEPGTHVNGIGSFRLDMRELDDEGVGRSSVFVDTVEGALHEAGELVHAETAGHTDRNSWTEIGRVLDGEHEGRRSPDEITFFKSVGNAAQDVCAAAAAVERAKSLGLGQMIEF